MKDKNKGVRYDMLVLKMRKKGTFLNIILIKMINSSHPFSTISRTVISMHTNPVVLGGVSHFSSQNGFIVTELFSLGGANDSLNCVLFTKWYFYHWKKQWQPKFLFITATTYDQLTKKNELIVWPWIKHSSLYKIFLVSILKGIYKVI